MRLSKKAVLSLLDGRGCTYPQNRELEVRYRDTKTGKLYRLGDTTEESACEVGTGKILDVELVDPKQREKDLKEENKKNRKKATRRDSALGAHLLGAGRRGSGLSVRNGSEREEEIIGRIEGLEILVSKIKLLLSGIIKCSSVIPDGMIQIIEEVFSSDEIEQLNLAQHCSIKNSGVDELFMSKLIPKEVPERVRSVGFPTELKEKAPGPSLFKELSLLQKDSFSRTQSMVNKDERKAKLHFGMVYSNPLVVLQHEKGGSEILYTNDPVDFATECTSILDVFQEHGKRINVHIQCAQADQLIKLILKKPKILHIMCHGDFDSEVGEYYLEFENNKAELLKLSVSKLRLMLRSYDLSDIALIFVNACHSEEVAKVFLEFGVRSIIVVQGKHKIDDSYAKLFSRFFYECILEGETIKEAFSNSIMQIKAFYIDAGDSCCCGHQHKPDCLWKKKAKVEGLENLHYEHESHCDCPNASLHLHRTDCDWAFNFTLEYNPQIDMDGDDDKEIKICCCCPELPHDETMKLKLIYKDDDESEGNVQLFQELDYGSVNQMNSTFFSGVTFKDCLNAGQNLILYKMFNSIINENIRIVYLTGPSGCGKSDLAKHLSNYLEERTKLTDAKYVNLDHIHNTNAMNARLSTIVYLEDSVKGQISSSRFRLMILDHCNDLVEKDTEKFRSQLLDIIQNSSIVIIVLTSNKSKLKEGQIFSPKEKMFSVPGINTRTAAKILIELAGEYLPVIYRNVTNLEKTEIFASGYNFMQKEITELALQLRNGETLDQLEENMRIKATTQENHEAKTSQIIELRREFLRQFRNYNPQFFAFYCFLSSFSNGITVDQVLRAQEMELVSEDSGYYMYALMITTDFDNLKSFHEEKDSAMVGFANGCSTQESLYELSESLGEIHGASGGFWVEIERISIDSKTDIQLKTPYEMSEALKTIIEGDETLKFETTEIMLKYYRASLDAIVHRNKSSTYYLESEAEASTASSSIFYKSILYPYQQIEFSSTKESEIFIQIHDPNVKRFLLDQGVLGLNSCLKSHELFPTIEHLLLSFLTVLKMSKAYDECIEYCLLICSTLRDNDYYENNQSHLGIKIELLLCVLYVKKFSEDDKGTANYESIISQLNVTERLIMELDIYNYCHLQGELLLTKYLFLEAKIGKVNCSLDESFGNTTSELERVTFDMASLQHTISELKECQQDDFEFLRLRLQFVSIRFRESEEKLLNSDLDDLIKCKNYFAQNQIYLLQIKACLDLTLLLENCPEDCLKHANEGLTIAEKVNQMKHKRRFEEIISKSFSVIRAYNANKMYFISSYPLRNKKKLGPEGVLSQKYDLRELLKADLEEAGKKLVVCFNVLTSETANEIFVQNTGGKLLVLDLQEGSKGELQFEKKCPTDDLIQIENFLADVEKERKSNQKDITLNGSRLLTFDIVVLINGPTKKILEIARLKDVPAILYFDISGIKQSYNDMFYPYIISEFKYQFVKNLTKKLVAGYQLENAMVDAEIDTFEELNFKLPQLKKYYECEIISEPGKEIKIRGKKIEFPKLEDIFKNCIKLEKQTKLPISIQLEAGRLREMDSYQQTHLRFSRPIINRNSEVVQLLLILKNSDFVNLYGESSCGKSSFAQIVKIELRKRNTFQDGVFVFDLSKIKHGSTISTLKDLIKLQLGEVFEHNMMSFFSGKRMLLIFDNFDRITLQKEIRYPTFLLRTLQANNIKGIFISSKIIESELEVMEPFYLPKMNYEMALALSLTASNSVFIKFNEGGNSSALYWQMIKQKSSNLKSLKNMMKDILDHLDQEEELEPPPLMRNRSRCSENINFSNPQPFDPQIQLSETSTRKSTLGFLRKTKILTNIAKFLKNLKSKDELRTRSITSGRTSRNSIIHPSN